MYSTTHFTVHPGLVQFPCPGVTTSRKYPPLYLLLSSSISCLFTHKSTTTPLPPNYFCPATALSLPRRSHRSRTVHHEQHSRRASDGYRHASMPLPTFVHGAPIDDISALVSTSHQRERETGQCGNSEGQPSDSCRSFGSSL